ncbi:MAG: glycosyltransferase family 2 protein [Lachnospiraceae bacterium]|nr:glycosyltransferase family 2 protein [Lachnospiraceae bacterium]
MQLEMLISSVNQKTEELLNKMHVNCDAVLVNQCDKNIEEKINIGNYQIKVFYRNERGVGKSRNFALEQASKDILLFSDEDIEYCDGYEQDILNEFGKHPEADLLLFNVEVCPERKTYWNEGFSRVKWYNCGRYPAYSIAVRKEALERSKVRYSELFGGGAKYSNGEDSLFLKQCADRGLRMYATDVVIGKEEARESTWFKGYTEKFFFDRGVLFAFLYGNMAWLWALRFVLTKKEMFQGEIKQKQAYRLIREGIRQGEKEKKMQ